MIGLKVMLLGGFEARLASGATLHLPTKKAQALLAYLARSTRPESPPRQARGPAVGREERRSGAWWSPPRPRRPAPGARRRQSTVLADRRSDRGPEPRRGGGRRGDVRAADVAEGTPQALEQAAELYRGDLLLGFTRERAALRGVARRRAGAAAGDGAGGLGAAAGPSEPRPRARSAPFRRRCGCSGSIPCRRRCTARSCGSTPARGGGERRSSNTRCAWGCCGGSWGPSPRRRRGSSIRNCFGARPRR